MAKFDKFLADRCKNMPISAKNSNHNNNLSTFLTQNFCNLCEKYRDLNSFYSNSREEGHFHILQRLNVFLR